MDIFSDLEISEDIKNKHKKNKTIFFKFIIKIQIFFKLLENDLDTLEMIYAQNYLDFKNSVFPITESEIVLLTSYLLIIEFANKGGSLQIDLDKYIPIELFKKNSPQVWMDKIMSKFTKFSSQFSPQDAKFFFLDVLNKKDLYKLLFLNFVFFTKY